MCDAGYQGTGTKTCKPGDAADMAGCPADACSPGGECVPTGGDYSCQCSVALLRPDPYSCPLVDRLDGTLFQVAQNLTWQKEIGTTPKGALSPYDDARTAAQYCTQVMQPAATWRAPTPEEIRGFPPLAGDRRACFGTTDSVVCNDLPEQSGQTATASSLDMRCVH
jgi:hypothetical protein